jgi:hypothetical protein
VLSFSRYRNARYNCNNYAYKASNYLKKHCKLHGRVLKFCEMIILQREFLIIVHKEKSVGRRIKTDEGGHVIRLTVEVFHAKQIE